MLPPSAPAAPGDSPGQCGTCHLFTCVTFCCESHQPGGDEPQILLPRVEHRCRCHPGDHLDGIWRESEASGENVHQLGTVSNAIAWEYRTSSLRVTFLPADLVSPGFQPPPPQLRWTAAVPGSIKALRGFFYSWPCKHPAPVPAGCVHLCTPIRLLTARGPAAWPSTAWVNGRAVGWKRPFFIVTADTEKKKH